MSDAYDMIDRFLRNNLGSDDDYAEYSKALDSLCGAQPAQAEVVPLPPQVMVDMVPPATARDRWMYEQGRLAERDPRTHAAPQQAEAVPPGYVLVPVEPTEAMLKAASRACEGRLYPADMRHGPRAQNSDRYRAMIAAAIAQQKGGV